MYIYLIFGGFTPKKIANTVPPSMYINGALCVYVCANIGNLHVHRLANVFGDNGPITDRTNTHNSVRSAKKFILYNYTE